MATEVIATRSKPRRNVFRPALGPMSAQNSVRAYRCSPEDIMLQIRREKDYVTVALTFDEARRLAAILDGIAAGQ